MARSTRLRWLAVLLACAGTAGCGLFDKDDEACVPGIRVSPDPGDRALVSVPANSSTRFEARIDLCEKGDPAGYTLEWYYDTDGDGKLSDAELAAPVAQTPEFDLIACWTDAGDHPMRILARPIEGEDDGYQIDLTVRVLETEGAVERPACYQAALDTIRNAFEIDASNITPLIEAADCLDGYLEVNICDFQASYASGLARFAQFMSRVPERFENRADMTPLDILAFYEGEVIPIAQRFLVVAQKAPTDFRFEVPGRFELTIFEDLPYLPGSQEMRMLLGGTHDMGEVYGIAAAASGIRGGVEMLLAYDGIIQFGLDIPQLDQVNFDWFRNELIKRLIQDPGFARLVEDAEVEGTQRLLFARGAFMDAINYLQRAVRHVRTEVTPADDIRPGGGQTNHLLRYWDCGEDGLCDCTNQYDLYLGLCPNNPNDYDGPQPGERDGRYTPGEPVGTNRIGFPDYTTIALPSNLDEFLRQLDMLRDNIRGPDALDLDAFTGAPVRFSLRAVDIPYPEIRLSQWFLSPAHPRDLAPLYSKSSMDVIFVTEGEPFEDVGYDGLPSEQEVTVHPDNPLGHPLGTPYHPLNNPDPAFDNLNPFCNPHCNFNDGIDNDGDGLADDDDRMVAGGFSVPLDLGVEGNLVFDFVDFNDNFRHDPGEPSEPFQDVGVIDHRGNRIGAGNNRWDFADRAHEWPTGDDIGPFGDIVQVDPANGTQRDALIRVSIGDLFGTQLTPEQTATLNYAGLYDPYYFFYPDATFSGVIRFPESVVSIDGRELTDNAKLQRFINKALELGAVVRIGTRPGDGRPAAPREGFGHPCSERSACEQSLSYWGWEWNTQGELIKKPW